MENKVKTIGQKQDAKVISVVEITPKFSVRKKLAHKVFADDVVNRFAGLQPVAITEITDENGKLIYTDAELKAKGCTFATITVERNYAKEQLTLKKHRETKEPNPFLTDKTATEKYTFQVLLNCIWQNVVDRAHQKVDGEKSDVVVNKERSNGILSYKNSRVMCHKFPTILDKATGKKVPTGEERFYVNYVVLRYLSDRVVTDENGSVLTYDDTKGYNKTTKEQKAKSKQQQADKHGIPVELFPTIQQMKLDNLTLIKMFGIDYQPIK